MGFKTKEIAEKFVKNMSILSSSYIDNQTKLSMQFFADIMKDMSENKLITEKDLYTLSEKEIINKIEKCDYNNISKKFELWKNLDKVNESDEFVKDTYCVSIKAKLRYIIPLVKEGYEYKRINEISFSAREDINRCINFKTKKYAYLNFDF